MRFLGWMLTASGWSSAGPLDLTVFTALLSFLCFSPHYHRSLRQSRSPPLVWQTAECPVCSLNPPQPQVCSSAAPCWDQMLCTRTPPCPLPLPPAKFGFKLWEQSAASSAIQPFSCRCLFYAFLMTANQKNCEFCFAVCVCVSERLNKAVM